MPVFIHTRPAKMPFFQRQCYGPDPSFAPLVRLLNDWDTIARDSVHQRRYHRTGQTFTPKFDVIETENEYQLHGELGGVSKENLNIEFTDEHTLVVKGRVQKSYKASSTQQEAEGTPADQLAAETEAAVAAAIDEDDIEESTIIDVPVDARASHQASVSDEEDEERTIEKQDAAAIEALQQEKRQEEEKQRQREQQQQQQPQEPAYKYWLAERSVGEFTRVFKFPGRVERDAVTAGLENGILTVTVPKAKALAVREIPIF